MSEDGGGVQTGTEIGLAREAASVVQEKVKKGQLPDNVFQDNPDAQTAILDLVERDIIPLGREVSELRFDSLMGDLNILTRSGFKRRLVSEAESEAWEETRRQTGQLESKGFAVMMLDLDGLGEINGKDPDGVEPGHDMGDAALYELGKVLVDNSRGGALIARVAGDEFVVFIPVTSEKEAEGVLSGFEGKVGRVEKIKSGMKKKVGVLAGRFGDRWPKGKTKDGRTPGEVSVGTSYVSKASLARILQECRERGEENEFITKVLKDADKSMYEDKNRVAVEKSGSV